MTTDEEEKPAVLPVSWLDIREKVVEQALEDGDYEALRRISALPGGFGGEAMRRRVWPVLLQTERFCGSSAAPPIVNNDERPAHKDESQVGLDTNRSFVTYPSGILPERKKAMQADLYDLIVGVLRHYPALSYFQGYHDILSVFYLTFITPPPAPPRSRPASRLHSRASSAQPEKPQEGDKQSEELQEKQYVAVEDEVKRDSAEWAVLRQCAEAVSVLRVRDAMGSGMEGMMGMLRILKRILKAADPDLAHFSSQISPVPTLPFFALSWILCLFSHDVDTLEPVQRMFDFLLARNPISAIYLAVAVLMAKKPQMLEFARQLGPEAADDPSLLHPLFSRLPPLFPDTPDQPTPELLDTPIPPSSDTDDPNPYRPIPLSELFQLADKLMIEHPWDGDEVKGHEIMGPGSVVMSYDLEMAPRPSESTEEEQEWTLSDALALIDEGVVRPGVGMMDDEEEEEVKPVRKVRVPRRRQRQWLRQLSGHKAGTAVAVGVVILGVGMAVFGVRAGGSHANWARWWAVVIGKRLGGKVPGLGQAEGSRISEAVGTASELASYLVTCLRGVL